MRSLCGWVRYTVVTLCERNARTEDTERINTCRTGPFPAFVEDADEEDEAEPTPEQFPNPEADFPDEPLEEGD